MLKKLRIQNFKCWHDTGDIELAPLTLLFGANSSGKSSIGQFLMMLKQTAEKGERKAAFCLESGTKDSFVQLGSFKDIAYHHELGNGVEFSYSWDAGKDGYAVDPFSEKEYRWNKIDFNARVEFGEKNSIPRVKNLSYVLKDGPSETLGVTLKRQAKGDYKLSTTGYELKRPHARVWNESGVLRFYGFTDEVNVHFQNAQFVQTLNFQQEQLFRSIYYLGPMRSRPGRVYSWTGNEPDGVGEMGENSIAAMLAAKDRKINFGQKQRNKSFMAVIAEALKMLGLIEEFKVARLSENNSREYEVKIRTRNSQDWVDLPDVGFGISQVLPVLVACFYVPAGSILIIEEPEIHLHPSAQSALADVLINVIKSRENGKDRGVQLIIETHSEHFLRRLQRRIAEDAISHESLAGYFIKTDLNPFKLERLDVDLFGNIRNWPKDFFGDEFADVIGLARAASKKAGNEGAHEQV